MALPNVPAFWSAPSRQVDPAANGALIVPSNSTNNVLPADRWIRVGGAGFLVVDYAGNNGLGAAGVATAVGTVTMSGTNNSDTDHIVVGGTDVSFTAGATDILSATAAVTALNANGTVNKRIVASNVGGTVAIVTLTAISAGKFGNAVTTTASGTGVTANQVALLGGVGGPGNYLTLTVAAGQKIDAIFSRIYILGTTATNLVAEW